MELFDASLADVWNTTSTYESVTGSTISGDIARVHASKKTCLEERVQIRALWVEYRTLIQECQRRINTVTFVFKVLLVNVYGHVCKDEKTAEQDEDWSESKKIPHWNDRQ